MMWAAIIQATLGSNSKSKCLGKNSLAKRPAKPITNSAVGNRLWWCSLKPCRRATMPMPMAKNIIPNSKYALCRILKPSNGRLVKISGSTAQCMAQTTEAAMPKLSHDGFINAIYKLQRHCKIALQDCKYKQRVDRWCYFCLL